MKTKTTPKVSVSGILLLFLSLIFLGSTSSFAATGGDCDLEVTVSGNVEKVISNWGVGYDYKIKNAPDGLGAHFFDNGVKLIVKLDDMLDAGQKITVVWKRRDYNCSYSGPAKLKIYESKDGSSYTYNSTITTSTKSYYVNTMVTLNDDTKYLKLVNASAYNAGSPDFYVDAIKYSYTICNDHCLDGPEPGTPCDDGNPNTTNDVINDNCECKGTVIPGGGTFTVCARIDSSKDDAEEGKISKIVNTSSSDLEFVLEQSQPEPNIVQIVGMRFNNLNIPQGATITSAYIQFTADASIGVDPCNLNIRGEASDNAAAFTTDLGNISSRPTTSASVLWSPPSWNADDHEAAQLTSNIAAVIQEIVNRGGYAAGNSIVIIIDGEGKRTAKSYDGSDSHAPILCVTYQTGCQDSDNDGVCNDQDLCNGYDDTIDVDHDGTPDGCDDCINEVNVSGNATKVICNWGVYKDYKILGAPDNVGAEFFDDGDKIVVKLEDEVAKGQQITVVIKKRDYQSSYTGPAQVKVYESENGYCWYYNKTIITDVKSYFVEKMFTLDHKTRYIKLVNASSCYEGSPDFYIDAVTYGYKLCDEVDHCPNGPEPGTACDDGNPNTINDVITPNCNCAGTTLANYSVCKKIDSSSDDAEEGPTGIINLTSGDLELIYDNSIGDQVVGLRFNNLNIPQGAVINSASIKFTVDVTTDVDPCELTIAGEASDNAATFTSANDNISSRPQTNAFSSWEPADWTAVGATEQTTDISAVIQEIVSRTGYTSASSIAIIIEGIGKRTARSFNGVDGAILAPELCINYSPAFNGNNSQGMADNDNQDIDLTGMGFGINMDSDPDSDLRDGSSFVEDGPEVVRLASPSISVFPIPASKDLKVDLTRFESRAARLSIYNQLGQLQEVIEIEEISPSPFELNLDNYLNGVYHMNIEIENARAISKKFIVNRLY